jgi:hypothetical protein
MVNRVPRSGGYFDVVISRTAFWASRASRSYRCARDSMAARNPSHSSGQNRGVAVAELRGTRDRGRPPRRARRRGPAEDLGHCIDGQATANQRIAEALGIPDDEEDPGDEGDGDMEQES